MNGLLDELGRKIADKWLTTLLIPGLLWVCTAVLAWQLAWSHALDPHAAGALLRRLDAGRPADQTFAVVITALIAAAGVGIAADGLSTLVRGFWVATDRNALSRLLRDARRRRWERAGHDIEAMEKHAVRTGDASGLDAVPEYATWIGDRLRENQLRIERAYGLDLTAAWPRLWAVAGEPIRADIAVAQATYASAGRLVAWALLYGLIGLFWGPALLIAAVVLFVGVQRARTATELLCQLVESCVDLYGADLAAQLRIPCDGVFSKAVGESVSALLRKDRKSV